MSEEQTRRGGGGPALERPHMPATYGVGAGAPAQPVLWDAVRQRLEAARNYWVVTVRADGRPHAMPVWGVWHGGAVCFSTDPASRKGRNLAANPEVVVHLESGDDVVVVEGTAAPLTDPDALTRFADAYEAKYRFRPDVGDPACGVYRVRPRVVFAWVEQDFPTTATRWSFGDG